MGAHFQPYLARREAPSESPQAVVPAACPTRPGGYAGTVRGERTESLLSAQIPHTGQCQWSAHTQKEAHLYELVSTLLSYHSPNLARLAVKPLYTATLYIVHRPLSVNSLALRVICIPNETKHINRSMEWMFSFNSMAPSSYSKTTYI